MIVCVFIVNTLVIIEQKVQSSRKELRMKEFVITTETNSDLPQDYLNAYSIGIIPHYYDVDGVVYGEDKELTVEEFYNVMRAGKMPTTMASNPAVIRDTFQKYVKQGLDVLHISFSSALSSGYNNVALGAKEICEENKEAKIIVIDTLNVSLGEGMMIMKAVKMREQGKSIEETAQWLEEHKQEFCTLFTVDDLFHLQRGGRLSKASAIVGSMINLKPILHVDEAGSLVSLGTTRGRKKSLIKMIDTMIERMGKYREEKVKTICVVHGDSLNDAYFVRDLVKQRLEDTSEIRFVINSIGPSIGAHSGPGTIGIIFMGEQK